ncbi:MAG: rod shape-determining protein, partial [Lactobacillus iners]|nr:rod shape-determining protein [Lactobacillus iners]MCT7730311.1 rod shape-determining protein [Lactobacillus iners]
MLNSLNIRRIKERFNVFGLGSKNIGIDLGTANTLVY